MNSVTKNHYNRLKEFETCLNSLNISSKLYDSETIGFGFPILIITLGDDYKSDPLEISAFLSPYLDESSPDVNYLQLSYVFDLHLSKTKTSDMLILLNKINSLLIIGNFVIEENKISFRYTAAVSAKIAAENSGFPEILSIFSLLLINLHELIYKTSAGIFSLEDAQKIVTDILNNQQK